MISQKQITQLLQTKIAQYRQMRASNYEFAMGGVTTGPLAVIRWQLLAFVIWGSLAIGLAILFFFLSLAGASPQVAALSFYAFMLFWLCLSFTDFYSWVIYKIVEFFESGILPKVINFFSLRPSDIFTRTSRYVAPIPSVPSAPPRSHT
jgi:hypothetical protein